MFIKSTLEVKERQSGRRRAFITLIQQLYFKTKMINVIIDFHFMDKTTRKKNKISDNSENESKKIDLDQKRELQKCNEIIMSLVIIEMASNVTLLVACGENNKCL